MPAAKTERRNPSKIASYEDPEVRNTAAIVETSEDEEDVRCYEPIELLQDAGINATDISKLKEDGFATIGQLFQVSQRRLLMIKGISEAKVEKVSFFFYS